MKHLLCLLAFIGLGVELCSSQVVVNGSFETGPTPPFGGTYVPAPNSTTITGWTVQSGSVDYIGSDTWQTADGDRSLDLSGHEAGTIVQSISSFTPGRQYRLSFYMAGNNDGAARTFSLQARIGSVSQTFTFDATGYTYANMGWSLRTMDFTATNATMTLSFTSLNDGLAGPALDNVGITTTPEPCVSAPSGLVGWWKGDGNALDSGGTNHGTVAGNTTYGNAQVGQGFVFDGNHDGVQVAAATNLQLQDFTIEAWVKRSSPNIASQNLGGGLIFSFGSGGYGLDVDDDGHVYLVKNDAANVMSSFHLTDTNWHHLAATKAGTSVVFCLDGVSYPAAPYDVTFTFDTLPAIGARGDGFGNSFLGSIDEVAVYNRALSDSEIQALVTASSAGKCVVSNPPPVAPVIVSQPTNVTVYVGSNATFHVMATGDPPLSYQWRFGGNDLPGKTSSVLTLTGVQISNAEPYSVVVSNAGGFVTSSNAVLTVNPLPDCAPPPAGLVSWWRAERDSTDNWDSNNASSSAKFAAGKVGLAFSNPILSVPDAASLRVTNGLTLEAWVNPSSVAVSTPRIIISKFDNPLVQPVGTQSAYLLGTTNNGQLFFTVSATGSARTNTMLVTSQVLPTNQWSFVVATYDGAALRIYLNGTLAAQTNYSSGIFPGSANLGIGAISFNPSAIVWPFAGLLDEVSLYNRALTDGEIQAIFNADVVGKCLVTPTIVTQPQDQIIPLGEDVKFTVSVLGSRPLKYQWRFNNEVISGATNAVLVVEKLKTNQAGFYHVVVTNPIGSAISARAQLTLLPAPICTAPPAGLVSWWPADGNQFDAMGANNIASFSPTLYVTGKADRAFSFNGLSSRILLPSSSSLNFGSNADFSIEMWIKAGASNTAFANVPLFEKREPSTFWVGYSLSLNQGRLAFAMGSSPVSATNVSTFISPGPDLRDAMFHHVAVSVNRTETNGGNLYVDGQLVLTFDPTPRKGSLTNTLPAFLGAPATTTSNSYFGGLIDEPAIYSRALSSSEILAIRQAGAAGKCKVKPTILVQPSSQRVTIGSNVTFSVTAAGWPPLRYQWRRNGLTLASNPTNSSFSFIVQPGSAANFSVRVTNLFGTVTSSNAALTLNHAPTAYVSGQPFFLPEDTSLTFGTGFGDPAISAGSDLDNDPLSFIIVMPPTNGTITLTASNMIYQPTPNYNGPDSFSYKLNDGLADSNVETVHINFLPVNDPPVAQSQSVSLDEDTTAAITLGAFDVDGDSITFTVGTPAHGTLNGTPPNMTYVPNTNYFGRDRFTFSVSDGQTNSQIATISITVIPVNDAPVARITVSPLNELPGITNLLAISSNNVDVTLVLDGSQSSDVENDPLQFSWLAGTNIFATGAMTTNVFTIGSHTITLAVSDGAETSTAEVTVEVLSPAEAVYLLVGMVQDANLGRRNDQPLLASLNAAVASFNRGNFVSGVNQLQAFQNKVRAQIAPLDPVLAEKLIAAAQEIIGAAEGRPSSSALKTVQTTAARSSPKGRWWIFRSRTG